MKMELEILGMNFGCIFGAVGAGNFPQKDCFLPLLSKVLGYCIVAASTTVKLPQILKILKHNSIRGLSVTAFELEVVGYTIALSYCLHNGLPFSAYGELAFLLVQAIVLVAILYYYSAPLGVKAWMKALLIPQIWENYKNKSTGELSYITCLLNFAGSIARVFTSMQEKAPTSIVLGSVLGILTNGTILSQIIVYQKPPAKKRKTQ